MIDNVLYYISSKTQIKIKEHLSKTKVIVLDLPENMIRYEKRTEFVRS